MNPPPLNPPHFERLINLMILLLESSRPVSSAEIRETVPGYGQEKVDAFKRMFERDKQALREMGVPIESEPIDAFEEEPGYRIPKDKYYLPELELADDEIAALWVAAGLLKIEDPGSAWIALMKLGGDPHIQGGEDASQLKLFSVDLGLDIRGLATAFEAISERKTVTFRYRSSNEKESRRGRTVDPYGIVHRKGSWYLVGRDHDRDDQRSFRFDRMEGELHEVDPTQPGPQFEVASGFNPSAALAAPPFALGEDVIAEAVIALDAPTGLSLERNEPWVRLDRTTDGWTANVQVTDTDGFLNWVLLLGEGAEIKEPPEMREAILKRLEKLCD